MSISISNDILNESRDSNPPATVGVLARHLKLENLTPGIDIDSRPIKVYIVMRPSLQLAGFFGFFEYKSVQILGRNEQEYMKSLPRDLVIERFEKIASYGIPCVIFTWGYNVGKDIVDAFGKYGVPVFKTQQETAPVYSEALQFLRTLLAPRKIIHGVLVEVSGEGILLRGESGMGKSETALELVKRGHRLVSDDVVEIRKITDDTLIGVAPEVTRNFIELRGVGIINVRALYGFGAIKSSQSVDMIINLEEAVHDSDYDRFGLRINYEELMGVRVASFPLPVKPGRNIANLVETMAIYYRGRTMGYNAPKEFLEGVEKAKKGALKRND